MHTGIFSSIPMGYLMERSVNYRDILVGFKSPKFSFSQIGSGIKLTIDPRSHSYVSMTNLPITHGIGKLLGFFNFCDILFWIMELQSAVSAAVSSSSIFFLFDRISFRNLA